MPEDTDFVTRIAAAYHDLPPGPPVDVGAVRAGAARRRRRLTTLTAGVAGVAVAASVAAWTLARSGPDPGGPLPTQAVGTTAIEVRASDTAQDWAGVADVVVVGRVTGEKAGRVSPADDGTGDAFVRRAVVVSVLDQVWAPGEVTVPREITLDAPGWIRNDGELTARLTYADRPRLEPGHTYVLALLHDRCGKQWEVLGSGGALPYENGALGQGESAGQVVGPQERQDARGPLERELAGRSASDLRAILEQLLSDGTAERREPRC